jgi:hypothetical protein
MRENSRFEMMRAAGAKAVVSVEMAVPPTMVAGELSVENSEGETSDEWRRFLRRRLFGLGLDDKPHRVVQSGEHTGQRWQAIK